MSYVNDSVFNLRSTLGLLAIFLTIFKILGLGNSLGLATDCIKHMQETTLSVNYQCRSRVSHPSGQQAG